MKILITGFMPFGGEAVNPAWEAVKALPDTIDGVTILKKEIPVVFGEAFETVRQTILESTCPGQGGLRPCDSQCEKLAAVVCVGQAGGRSSITPEKVAINLRDGRIADNAGNQPSYEPVRDGGPVGYFSTLPLRQMISAMTREGISASLSLSAGAYVCNDLFYSLMDYLAAGKLAGDDHISAEGGAGSALGGFIHVPFSSEQLAGRDFGGKTPPSLPLSDITRGLEICLRELIAHLQTLSRTASSSEESMIGELYETD